MIKIIFFEEIHRRYIQMINVTYRFGIEKSAEELFQETEIGHFVLEHLAIENLKEATRLYMSDFVKMSHKASCSREEMVQMDYPVSNEELYHNEYLLF